MNKPVVYYHALPQKPSHEEISRAAYTALKALVDHEHIHVEKSLPIKIHSGQPGNITFIKPNNFDDVIDYLVKEGSEPYFVETNMVTGPRSKEASHRPIAESHGFTRIPFVIGDGEDGEDHVEIPIKGGKHFKTCKIARGLTDKSQVVVMSHFKGHCATGFGAAIKMLGIGFASRRGKIIAHTKNSEHSAPTIDWSDRSKLYWGDEFSERVAEYALAAVDGKQYIYLNFAIDITSDCDCDGRVMEPIYKDLGVFASTDPVAIDKACFDVLVQREHREPFSGDHIFDYAEKLGLGTSAYELITI